MKRKKKKPKEGELIVMRTKKGGTELQRAGEINF